MDKYLVAVVGASGYTGIELVRLLLGHEGFELVAATSDSGQGQLLSQAYPALYGQTDLRFSPMASLEGLDLDAVFLAVPHTAAMEITPYFLGRGISVFDLSADFRLRDPLVYEQWYGHAHTAPGLLPMAVYGLPELYRSNLREVAEQRQAGYGPALVACPGCYPTASALAIAPAIAAGAMLPDHPVIINAISGASGMGKQATEASHFISINEDMRAYNVGSHRHTPEIAQTLSTEAGHPVKVQFTPHLVPISRGLLATVTLSLLPNLSQEIFDTIYSAAYADEPFAKLLPDGQMPQTSSVRGSNMAQIGIRFDAGTDQLVACCAIDNLGKGASSQAVQCANIIFGYPETTGLDSIGSVV